MAEGRKPRGVRLTDLDRDKLWVIGHNGRRWETIGPLSDVASAEGWRRADAGASDGVARTAPHAPAPAAATPARDDGTHR